jgi:hypothetical protein
MFNWIEIVKFFAAFHHPWRDCHRQRDYECSVTENITYMDEDTEETFIFQQTTLRQTAGDIKALTMSLRGMAFCCLSLSYIVMC